MTLEESVLRDLAELARSRGSNLNDTAVAILAEHHRVPYEPTNIDKAPAETASAYRNFEMPERLRDKINDAHVADNRRRRRAGGEKRNRGDFLNEFFAGYLLALAA